MKQFDLEKALAGEPVRLREGKKAFVIGRIPEGFIDSRGEENSSPLRGFAVNNDNVIVHPSLSWDTAGQYLCDALSMDDIIGMWEESINPEDLPKPFKPKQDETYFYICAYNISRIDGFSIFSTFDKATAENGQCFRTESDAQKWLDFMKSMME